MELEFYCHFPALLVIWRKAHVALPFFSIPNKHNFAITQLYKYLNLRTIKKRMIIQKIIDLNVFGKILQSVTPVV